MTLQFYRPEAWIAAYVAIGPHYALAGTTPVCYKKIVTSPHRRQGMLKDRGTVGNGIPQLFDSQQLETLRLVRKDAESLPAPEAAHPLPIIEAKFPRIAVRIVDLWGTAECDLYLDSLIIDDRGNRAGFPAEVMAALLDLSRQHQSRFGFGRAENQWVDDPLSKDRTR